MTYVEYSSNNSGGQWWLTDQNWRDLETAGWEVDWYKDQEVGFLHKLGEERFLGALASHARLRNADLTTAIADWEMITGQQAMDEGCNCCGAPHDFTQRDDDGNYLASISGDDVPRQRYPRRFGED
jgi:hypothetical protein